MTAAQDTPATPGHGQDETLGALVHDMTQQMSTLVRDEIRLAQAEMTEKGKRAGVGIGMFSAAGLLAFFGVATLIATAILALALALPPWLSALLVGVVLFIGAGVVALVGRNNVRRATPPKPEEAIEGLKEDVATVKGKHV
ncbi:MAG: phage holin family protein [Nocardioidaceae bacterium]|nr:phage holin family protein [Nocardioidaceae bacterium]NUS50903.1 phage holin family protein [Nocardioidaceae bacterium]